MSGRPVRLLSVAALAAIGSLLSVNVASAGCMSCGCAPAPVVYSYSPCGSYYAGPPMYVVNQGPAYTLPVPISAEPTPAYGYPRGYPYIGARPYYGDVYPRWHRRHFHHRYGMRGPGYDRYGPPGYRPYGARTFRPYIGPGRFYGDRFRAGPRFSHIPRARINMPHRMHAPHRINMPHRMNAPHRARPMRMRGPEPGVVHPPQAPKKQP